MKNDLGHLKGMIKMNEKKKGEEEEEAKKKRPPQIQAADKRASDEQVNPVNANKFDPALLVYIVPNI